MAFDKEKCLADINRTLEEMPLPGSPGNPISAGWVSRIIAQQGNIHMVLDLPPDIGPQRDSFRKALEERLAAVDQVTSVQILERSAERGATQASQGPQATPVYGGQGIPGVRHMIAVASGKGGVGKSTVAVNLAAELGRTGKRTGLLDADVYGPSIPKMMGLEGSRPGVTSDEKIEPIAKHGIQCMSIGFMLDDDSPVIWRGPMVTGLLRQFLFQVVWGDLDYLILDLPPGTGDAQLTLVQSVALSGGIIVTTPQDVALLDVQRGIQMFQRVEVPILGVVENMSLFRCPECGHEAHIFAGDGGASAAKRYGVPFLGSIPLDPRTTTACDDGMPIALADPQAPLSQIVQGIVAGITAKLP